VNSRIELRDKKSRLHQAEANAGGALCSRLSTRANRNNANHHLWPNGRVWWLHYTIHLPNYTKRRIRRSLKTANLSVARQRRDAMLAEYTANEMSTEANALNIIFEDTKFSVPIKQ